MDGRIQLPVIQYVQKYFKATYVDMITEASPVGVLALRPRSRRAGEIFRRVEISVRAHGSTQLAIVAHHDCAGNPVAGVVQKAHLEICMALLSERYPAMERIGLWVDADWKVQSV